MKSLIKKQSTELVLDSFEDLVDDVEDFSQQDLPRPSLRLGQTLTPQCKPSHEKYIQGCMPGNIINTSVREFWEGDIDRNQDAGVIVLPVKYMNREIEWLPNRGGFQAEHLPGTFPEHEIKKEKNADGKIQRILPNGNILVNTAIYHCFHLKENGSYDEVVVDMASSQWQCAKEWNSFMSSRKKQKANDPKISYKLPIYSNVYKLYSKTTHKDDNDWYLWKVKHVQELSLKDNDHKRLIQNAIEYKKKIETGSVLVDREAE